MSVQNPVAFQPAEEVSRRAFRGTNAARLAVLAVFAMGACLAVRAALPGLLVLLDAGNVMGTNDESSVTIEVVRRRSAQIQGLLSGAALLLSAAAMRALFVSVRARAAARRAPLALVLAACGLAATWAIGQRCTSLDGQAYYFLQDDAMTSMVYARHWAEGDGLVYQTSERVEGYSNPLWVALMALVHVFEPTPASAPLWVLVTSWALVALTCALLMDLLAAWRVESAWTVLAAALVLLDRNTWTWAVSGLETSAVGAGVMAGAWAIVRRRHAWLALALAVICLLRSDGFVLAALLGGTALATLGLRRDTLRVFAPALLVSVALITWRWSYYGYPLPNTYYLKMLDLGDRLFVGLGGYGWRLIDQYAAVLGIVLVAALWPGAAGEPRDPSGRALRAFAALVLLHAAYCIYVGGDIFKHLRFFAPVVPLAYACALRVLRAAVSHRRRASIALTQAFALGMCPVLAVAGRLGQLPDDAVFFEGNLAVAHLLRSNVAPGHLVTIYPAGTIPYYAPHLRYLDVFGKTDAHIAHLERYEGRAIGHNKSDFDYVYDRRRPDLAFVLFDCDSIDRYLGAEPGERKLLREAFALASSPVRLVRCRAPHVSARVLPEPRALRGARVTDPARVPVRTSRRRHPPHVVDADRILPQPLRSL